MIRPGIELPGRGSVCGIVANMLDWDIVVSKSKLQSPNKVKIWTYTLGKV